MRLEAISPRVRRRHYYSVPEAGARIGLSRTQAYKAAAEGHIPTEWAGKFRLVPKGPWDRTVKRVLRGATTTPRGRKTLPATI